LAGAVSPYLFRGDTKMILCILWFVVNVIYFYRGRLVLYCFLVSEFPRFTAPLPHPFIKTDNIDFMKILPFSVYLLTKLHKLTRAGYFEKY
jgi:hypothetical protein